MRTTSGKWSVLVGCLVIPTFGPTFAESDSPPGIDLKIRTAPTARAYSSVLPPTSPSLRTSNPLTYQGRTPTPPTGRVAGAIQTPLSAPGVPQTPTSNLGMTPTSPQEQVAPAPGAYQPVARFNPRAMMPVAPTAYGAYRPPLRPQGYGAAAGGAHPSAAMTGYQYPAGVGGYSGYGRVSGTSLTQSPFAPDASYVSPGVSATGTPAMNGLPQASAALAKKPFSDYEPPPAMSPWFELYRPNALGTINNYYTRVRPKVEQLDINARNKQELRSLDNAARAQTSSVNRLRQQTEVLQGTSRPSYYMNLQQYYPGLQQ